MISFLRRRREMMSPNSWKYWQGICEVLKGQIQALLKAPLSTTYLEAEVLVHRLIHIFVCGSPNELVAPEREPAKTESARDPPKRFIPIPDIETGGCARNDSLTAPVIN